MNSVFHYKNQQPSSKRINKLLKKSNLHSVLFGIVTYVRTRRVRSGVAVHQRAGGFVYM
jgi:hypothetical protein